MTTLSVPFIVGNWKMNGKKAEALLCLKALMRGLADIASKAQVVICPPATLIDAFVERTGNEMIWVGAQDCRGDECGARTGDVNADMVSDIGARLVILGHSERRHLHNESDTLIREKVLAAWSAGLVAVVCVGETDIHPDVSTAFDVVHAQLEASLPEGVTNENTIIAYEPVWAIGTGIKPDERALSFMCERVRIYLRGRYKTTRDVHVLYGGSVSAKNAAAIMAGAAFDGLLVGKASLSPEEFIAIARGCIAARPV